MTSDPPSSPPAGGPDNDPEDQVPNSPASTQPSVGRAGAIMAGGTFVSRLVGLVRTAMLTGVIGTTGYAADGFTAANTLPNSFYILIAGGALNAILVPQIVRAKLRPDGDEFVNRIITLSLAALAGATVLATLLAPLIVPLYYRTRSEEAIALAVVFAYVCLPQIFFYGLYTILGQVLNANGRFAGFMWAPALANVVAVAGLVVFIRMGFPQNAAPSDWTPGMIAVLAGSATLSIVAQAVCLVIPLRRMGFRYRPVWGVRGVGLGEVSNVAKWTFGSIVVSQLGFLVTSNVLTRATDLGERAGDPTAGLAAFNPALLLVMLPHGLITVSLVTALYTRLSEAASRDDHDEVMRLHGRGLRLPSVILVPGVVLIGVLAPYVASTFFFTNTLQETKAIAIVLQGLVWMVLPMAWTYLNDRVFYAHQMTFMSFRIQCVTTGLSSLGALVAVAARPRHHGVRAEPGAVLRGRRVLGRRLLGPQADARPHRPAQRRVDVPQAPRAGGAHRPGARGAHRRGPPRPRRAPGRRRAGRGRPRPRRRGGRPARRHLGRGPGPGRHRGRRRARARDASSPTALTVPVYDGASTRPGGCRAVVRADVVDQEEQR